MNNRLMRIFVLFLALAMPFQVFAMIANSMPMGKMEHCKQVQVAEHCQSPNNHFHQQKHTPKKADCCVGNTCATMCVGLMLPVSLAVLAFDSTSDFSLFIIPSFYSQLPDGLERPPRTLS